MKMISNITTPSNTVTSLQATQVRSLDLIPDTLASLYCYQDTRCSLVNIIESIKLDKNNEKNF